MPSGHGLPVLPCDVVEPEVAVAPHPMRCLTRRRIHQRDRKAGGERSKARIDYIGRTADRNGHEHVVPLRFGQRPKQNDPRGMTGNLKTECFKHGRKKAGVFETITATANADNLLLKPVKVETHTSAEQYVQVLKRDMRRMGLNKPRQCLKRR